MRLLLDCDGVVADFVGPLLRECAAPFGPEDVDRWDIFELMEDDVRSRAFAILEDAGFWRAQPVIEGAIEGVAALAAEADEVFWVTSPWEACFGWAYARKAWLAEHFGADPAHVVITRSKHLVVGDVFVDDSRKNVEAWAAEHPFGLAYLFDAPYNRSLPGTDAWQRTSWS